MQKKGSWLYQDLKTTESTNDSVYHLLEKEHQPCIISAQIQTKGRGRFLRRWESAPGNVFISFGYEISTQNIGHYALLSGLAVLYTLKYFKSDMDAFVKWPNDIMVADKKISGILFEKGPENYWIMGIGINVTHTPEIPNKMYQAVCLADLGIQTNRLSVIDVLIEIFDKFKTQYDQNGFSQFKSLWLDNCYQRDKKVVVKQNDLEIIGTIRGINDQAGLILETNEGFQTLFAGDVFKKDEK